MTWNWAWKTTALWNLQLSTLSMSWVSIMGWPPSLGATGSSILVSHQQLWCILMTFPNSNWKWNRQWVISKIEESKEQRPEIEPLKPPLPYENPSSVGITLILVTTPILALHLAWQMGLQCPPGSRRWFLLQVTVIILKHNVNWVACDGTLFSHWFGTSSCPLSLRYRLLKFGVFFTWGAVLGLGLWCTLGGGYGFFLAVIILKLTVDCFACIGVLFSSWFGSTVGQPLSLWCSIFNVSICSSCVLCFEDNFPELEPELEQVIFWVLCFICFVVGRSLSLRSSTSDSMGFFAFPDFVLELECMSSVLESQEGFFDLRLLVTLLCPTSSSWAAWLCSFLVLVRYPFTISAIAQLCGKWSVKRYRNDFHTCWLHWFIR